MPDRPRILFGWEMGANLGHAGKVTRVAAMLEDRAELFVAAREPVAIRQMAPDLKARLLPAPYSLTRPMRRGERPGLCFPGNLLTEGWESPDILSALCEAWSGLIELVRPDVIVAQAAPTLLLAARGQGKRTVMLGSGYDNPALSVPMPVFESPEPDAATVAGAQEAMALAAANEALARRDLPPAQSFKDLMEADLSLLLTWPEADHYPDRAALQPDHPEFLGMLTSASAGAAASWADNGNPRVFAYLRGGHRPSAAAYGALHRMGRELDTVLAAPGIEPADAARLRERGVQVFDGTVDHGPLLGKCDLGLSHGSNGMVGAFLAKGVPQIGLPLHREQSMITRAMARRNLALGLEGRYGTDQVVEAIRRILASRDFADRTRLAARKIASYSSCAAELIAADKIMELV